MGVQVPLPLLIFNYFLIKINLTFILIVCLVALSRLVKALEDEIQEFNYILQRSIKVFGSIVLIYCFALKNSVLTCDSRIKETLPVLAISIIPNLDKSCSIAAIFPGSPVTSNVNELLAKSTTLARKIFAISRISARVDFVVCTFFYINSRSTQGKLVIS